jgi:lysophospholipase L1-like esterase
LIFVRDGKERRKSVLSAIRKCGGLLRVPLVVLIPFGVLLVCGCSANEGISEGISEEETTTTANALNYWNYVALGDSLAVGTGASYEGYVDRYAAYLEDDTGAQISVTNLGRNGQTSSELLYALRNNLSWRRAVGEADVLPVNVGINDLGHAAEAYEKGACGGTDNQDCLHAAVQTVEGNWNSIIAELLTLRSTNDTVIRAAGLGYTPHFDDGRLDNFRAFQSYLDEVNSRIARTASDSDIPLSEVHLDKGYISQDRLHPNDQGYEVIAQRLRELGYSPLK